MREITDANFEEILNSNETIMIDFWAEWCGPCRILTPIVNEIAEDYNDKAVIAKVNVDDNPIVSGQFGIRSIPTVLFIKNGEVVDRSVGAVPKGILTSKLDSIL